MTAIELIIRVAQSVYGVLMTGLHYSCFGLVVFKLIEKLAPLLHYERPTPRMFKVPFELAVGVLLDHLGPKVDARTPSQSITAPVLLSIVGIIVIVSMTAFQITSLSATWGGAIVVYSVTGFAMPLESAFMSFVAISVLLAACLMWEANQQIQYGIKHA
ncbi:hypothetical protein [Halomontanus rarus]|uniref:hypothetical protein n=1 Tax=Halomontanus rarus TaxID=3034020 RepID=UPI0023E7B2D7|nr:hypothetical protein [Halovivax sp. TS33]